jgi:SPP1 gp7 family putative phage head morphogenesis protein
MFEYSDDDIDALMEYIYAGVISDKVLPEGLYLAIAEYLKKGLYDGFGGALADFPIGSIDHELITQLRENIYHFSGAKTYQQVREMSDLLVTGERVSTFKDFKAGAMEVFDQYNKTWLQTEYDTAIGQAQNGRLWNDIQSTKDVFPMLEYSAVMDANTSDICRPLDGIILPVDDPKWMTIMPLNHFSCRCTVTKIDKYGDEKETSKAEADEKYNQVTGKMQDVFKSNPGVTGQVFDKDHPYFDVAPGDRKNAAQNWGLPIPATDN